MTLRNFQQFLTPSPPYVTLRHENDYPPLNMTSHPNLPPPGKTFSSLYFSSSEVTSNECIAGDGKILERSVIQVSTYFIQLYCTTFL